MQFSKRSDAEIFYKAIVSEQELWILQECTDHFQVKLMNASCNETAYVESVRAFIQLIRKRKMLGWMEGILKFGYHFEDAEEIQRILEIGQEFEEKPPRGIRLPPIYQYLRSYIQDYLLIKNVVVFDELSALCLENVYDFLIEYTGRVIDEYKQEESYQMLVDSWRHRVHYKDTGVQLLHLVDDNGLFYFHYEGNPISESEIKLYMKQYPDPSIADLPLEWPVTTALVLAPDELIIYSDQSEDSDLDLLMRIFEEKASWRPKRQFPF
ncbi:putative sporulation protein YtxC [Halobacillus litoralis]|uniref:putative sporulation protein YtxC n=1 Tax=Halobacillus litoralis TaxID=45668 RepID=UPI001CFF2BD3|nr:putative sporulation protein YtxC [Halobacillus litoralis]